MQRRLFASAPSRADLIKNAFISYSEPSASSSSSSTPRIRVAVKDNFCTRDFPTGCASVMLRDYQSPFDATAVRILKEDCGAIIVGSTNMDEFGMGSSTIHSTHGPTRNPHNWDLVSGGSSGGSAAAVASGLCDVALGSDTGGSVRLPASYCGVFGFKPSYGVVSRHG
eukprot:Partr_v1_DN27778_c0_g1_i1_m66779 putative Allows the formation of correctly charged Gln-tRNA(Gln) through the transamidation of misacylated Glu-tRNA(Gln) in the mitochondria. The reaction takes place in the presence of glutamine and ATP through an activated gamma-phospho-Glu-tRNA(Gln) (By similarity)